LISLNIERIAQGVEKSHEGAPGAPMLTFFEISPSGPTTVRVCSLEKRTLTPVEGSIVSPPSVYATGFAQ
jgi:hypothetical protein